jgi:hypothetical protein
MEASVLAGSFFGPSRQMISIKNGETWFGPSRTGGSAARHGTTAPGLGFDGVEEGFADGSAPGRLLGNGRGFDRFFCFFSPHSTSPPRSLSCRTIRVLESLLGVGGVGGRYQPRLLMEVTREP